MHVRPLCARELVRRHSRPGTQRIYYSVQSTPFTAFLEAGARRFASYRTMIESEGSEVNRPGAQDRLQRLADLFQTLEDSHRPVLARKSSESAADALR